MTESESKLLNSKGEELCRCSKCGCTKLLLQYFSLNNKGEYNKTCDSCREKSKKWSDNNKEWNKKYREEHKKEEKENKIIYYSKNKSKIIEHNKKYKEENKDYFKEYKKNYYNEHKNEILEKTKQYYEENKDKMKECKKEWQQEQKNNLDLIINKKINRYKRSDDKYDRKYDEKIYITNKWVKNRLEECNYKCELCNKALKLTGYEARDLDQFSIDRICNKVSHMIHNCQITCWECNCKKH